MHGALRKNIVIYLLVGLLCLIGLAGRVTWFASLKHEITKTNVDNAQRLLLKRSTTAHLSNNDNDGSGDKMFCAVKHPVYGTYIDLSQLSTTPNTPSGSGNKNKNKNKKQQNQDQPTLPVKTRWSVNGWDYTTNFTLGICSSAVDDIESGSSTTTLSSVTSEKNNTGAFYYESNEARSRNRYTSIGEYSTTPRFMGKKLVLQYDNGDFCPNGIDKKTTLLNFVCDKEISSRAQINFIGSLHNCSYFFEVRSIYACPTTVVKDDYNVIGIFLFIIVVFGVVECGRRRLTKFVHSNRVSNGINGSNGDNRVYMHNENNSNANSMDSLNYLNYINPRWARIENESKFKSFAKTIFNKLHNLFSNGGSHTIPTQINSNNSNNSNNSRNSRGSNDTLFRDIEIQNNLMDSLQMDGIDEDEDVGGVTTRGLDTLSTGNGIDNNSEQRDLVTDNLV
ncbi:hypothetical protein ACO0RG_003795 [Hanseniaspora osmophila]